MTVSPTMQRYAAEIYRLQQDHEQVPLSLLSSHVDSSAQAISSMVKRLQKDGYLEHEPYRGVRLTIRHHYVSLGYHKALADVKKQDDRAVEAATKVEKKTAVCTDQNGYWDVLSQRCILEEGK